MRKRNTIRMSVPAIAMTAVMTAAVFPSFAYADTLKGAQPEEYNESEAGDYQETEFSGVASDGANDQKDLSDVSVSKADTPFYICDMETELDYPLYFINGTEDLPYIDLSDWVDLMSVLFGDEEAGEDSYSLTLETDGYLAMVTRENGYSMLVDFEAETISFDDYDAFIQMNGGNSLLDNVSDDYTDENGEPILIERIKKGSFDRYGKQLDLDLSAYRISLYWNDEEGIYLIPLQTLSDFLFANVFGKSLLYNTEAVYCADANLLGIADGEFTELGDSYYYSVPSGMLSEDLAWYSYCELCLALDNLYGLKESHDISSFDQVFRETGYAEDLMSTDPNIKDGALMDFINYYLDDMHSDFTFSSYLTDEAETIGGAGLASIRDSEVYQIYGQARENADHTIESYEEIGNTAYVTFDHFTMNEPAQTYYEGEVEVESDPASDSLETAALIIYANEQITREDSPIENVVIDLSLNGGGAVDAAAIVAAWYLGEASMSLKSTMTGATSTSTYRADINLDREFDEKDTVQDKNLFCIISPYSFSCGNLVANLFKSSGRVALIGRESGGGSCAILPISTAYGSLFQISSPLMISYMKNGSYYDTDTGIEPECVIVRPENFYDREALTQYINQLY